MERDLFAEEKHDGVAEVSCVGVVSTDTGEACGSPAKLRGFGSIRIPLCEPCLMRVCNWRNDKVIRVVEELGEAGAIAGDTDGWMYAIQMESGNVKFGTTSDPTLKRLAELTRTNNGGVPVEILGITRGGLALEHLTHGRFKGVRVVDRMEEFAPTLDVVEYAAGLGIPSGLTDSVERHRLKRVQYLGEKRAAQSLDEALGEVWESFTSEPYTSIPWWETVERSGT